MNLMAFQTIDNNVRMSQELDFRLILTSNNNDNHLSRPMPQDSLLVPSFFLVFLNYRSL